MWIAVSTLCNIKHTQDCKIYWSMCVASHKWSWIKLSKRTKLRHFPNLVIETVMYWISSNLIMGKTSILEGPPVIWNTTDVYKRQKHTPTTTQMLMLKKACRLPVILWWTEYNYLPTYYWHNPCILELKRYNY